MGQFDGKVALVTGAARGQGRAHVLKLASEGANVIAIDVCAPIPEVPYPLASPNDLKAVVAEASDLGAKVLPYKVDVRDRAAVEEAVRNGRETLGPIEIVIANAGAAVWGRKFWEFDTATWDTALDVNLRGVLNTCSAVAPGMIEAGRGGSIVVTASMAGLSAAPNLAPYSVAKHGVIGLVRCMAAELAEHRIRVNAICPTSVDTGMINNPSLYKLFRPDLAEPTKQDCMPVFDSLVALPHPLLDPAEVADFAAFLVSYASRSITGAVLPIDLGEALK